MDNQHSGRMANSWHFTPCSQTPHFELLLCISEKNTLNNSKHRQAKEQTNGLRRNKGAPKRNRPIVTTHFSSPAFSFARNSSRHFSCVNSLSTNFLGMLQTLEQWEHNTCKGSSPVADPNTAEGPLWGCSPARQRDLGHLQGKSIGSHCSSHS